MKSSKRLDNCYPKYAAELVGTFCLVFFGTGAIAVDQISGGSVGAVGICLVFGLIVLGMIYSIGHISGAHINPAVTIGFFSVGRLSGREVPFYISAQLIGAAIASCLIKFLFNQPGLDLGLTLPFYDSLATVFILELVLSGVLMFIIMGVATDHRAQGVMAGVAVGAYITLAALIGGPISGASMNPARSFGPALASLDFSFHWIYWIAPILGSVSGGLLYRKIQCSIPGKGDESGCC